MIKYRNLDNSLIQWIMTVTGLGPGIGDIKYVAPAVSVVSGSESRFAQNLNDMGVEAGDLYATPTLAEEDFKSHRNDIMLVMPGKYTQTASLAWDKAHTHILGLGGPNNWGHYRTDSASDMRNVLFHTITEEVAQVINVTGQNCQFHNFQIKNEGDNAANVAALTLNKYGAYFKGVNFVGICITDQLADAGCCSLEIAADGDYPMFEDCIIGHNTYGGTRTAENQGHLLFSSETTGPQNGNFRNCKFLSWSHTAACAAVRVDDTVTTGIDRLWTFDRCHFSNFSINFAFPMTRVFYTPDTVSTTIILLQDSCCTGYTDWQTTDHMSMFNVDNANAGTSGGICAEPTKL